jgi:hypothetical protein
MTIGDALKVCSTAPPTCMHTLTQSHTHTIIRKHTHSIPPPLSPPPTHPPSHHPPLFHAECHVFAVMLAPSHGHTPTQPSSSMLNVMSLMLVLFQVNSTLTNLNLACNKLGDVASMAIVEALQVCSAAPSTLTHRRAYTHTYTHTNTHTQTHTITDPPFLPLPC